MNQSEQHFYNSYLRATGIRLLFEPVLFRVWIDGVRYSYTPDFYCPVQHIFFEVSANRQAYHQDKFKIEAFRRTYPSIGFDVVNPDGSPYMEPYNQDGTPVNRRGRKNGNVVLKNYLPRPEIAVRSNAADRLRSLIRNSRFSLSEVSERTGVKYACLYRLVTREYAVPNMKTLRLLRSFLDSEEAA